MVLVAQAVLRHALEQRVVLHVRCRDHGSPRTRITEQRILERAEAWRVDVLDDLDNSDGVEVAESTVPIGERSLPQIHASTLTRRHLIETQPAPGGLQRSP